MRSFTLQHVASITGGTLFGDADIVITGVSTDTRTIQHGDLFCAIVGERVDAHDLISEAYERGAVAVLVSRVVAGSGVVVPLSPGLDPVIVALGHIARVQRETMSGTTFIGVTGSSGKTSTKDLIGQVLARHGATHAPAGSPNNELGLPLTILQAPDDTQFMVLEMGMRGAGHIEYLCDIARPTIGVVTNVGKAHIGELGSLAAIRDAKAELVTSLPGDGIAILNCDDANVLSMCDMTDAQVLTFGFHADSDVRAVDHMQQLDGTSTFELDYKGERRTVVLPLVGKHSVSNALAGAATGLSLGMSVDDVVSALHSLTTVSKWRMEIRELKNGITVINDAYNANPDSMSAALSALQSMSHSRRSWAVLGVMRELGDESHAEHLALGRSTRDFDVDNVVVVGADAQAIYTGALEAGQVKAVWLPDIQIAADYIVSEVTPTDIVLFKASRSAGLEQLVHIVQDRLGEDT
ncbi:MAG: UDP-N-acetylmuramoyl-tripeptide--D-alanyl-D-alanine ligase [Actinomycetes bacterium]